MIEKLINELASTEENRLIKTEYSLPDNVASVYYKVLQCFVDYYKHSVLEQKSINNTGFTNTSNILSELERENALNEDYIFKKGGKATLEENILAMTQKYVLIAGGCASDIIISRIHNTDYKPKDIDIFVDKTFVRSILNEEHNKEGYNGLYFVVSEILEPLNINEKRFIEHGVYGSNVDYIFNLNVDGFEVEVVGCDGDKLYGFDLSIRNVFANNNGVYTYPSVLEDIKSKYINLFSMDTQISSLFRTFNIARRYDFKLSNNTLIFLGTVLDGMTYSHFSSYAKFSSHYSEELENYIFKEMKVNLATTPDNEKVLYFPLSSYNGYSPDLSGLYRELIDTMEDDKCPFIFPLIERFLDHYKQDLLFTYEPPKTLPTDNILEPFQAYETPFPEWYNNRYLDTIFNSNDNLSRTMEEISTDDLDSLKKLFYGGDRSIFSSGLGEHLLVNLIPAIYFGNLKFELDIDLRDLKRGVLGLKTISFNSPITVNIHIDVQNKKISPYAISGNYFGLIGELYTEFLEQIKNYLDLEGYEVLSEVPTIPELELPETSHFSDHLPQAVKENPIIS